MLERISLYETAERHAMGFRWGRGNSWLLLQGCVWRKSNPACRPRGTPLERLPENYTRYGQTGNRVAVPPPMREVTFAPWNSSFSLEVSIRYTRARARARARARKEQAKNRYDHDVFSCS